MAYTNEQIQQIVDWFFTEGTRQYIGSRYVPIFADPIAHSSSRTYEPLTIVQHEGNSYTSKQYVPTGIAVTDTRYWALTGNYNAQIEQYREEVNTFDGRIDELEDKFPIQFNDIDYETMPVNYIFIGDSWGAGWTPDGQVDQSWYDRIRTWLTEQNIGVFGSNVGGSGILNGTTYYSQLVTLTGTLTNEQKESVRHIYMCGGWNDIVHPTQSDYEAAYDQLITYKNSNYPNADIVIVWFGSGNYAVNNIRDRVMKCRTVAATAAEAARYKKLTFVNATSLLYGVNGWSSDGYHPNNYGHSYIFSFMKSLICGCDYSYTPLSNPMPVIYVPSGDEVVSSNTIRIEPTIGQFNPTNFMTPEFFMSGAISFSTPRNYTFNGNTGIHFEIGHDAQASLFLSNRVCKTQTLMYHMPGVGYYAVPTLILSVYENDNISFYLYALAENADHNNYLSGNIDSIEML